MARSKGTSTQIWRADKRLPVNVSPPLWLKGTLLHSPTRNAAGHIAKAVMRWGLSASIAGQASCSAWWDKGRGAGRVCERLDHLCDSPPPSSPSLSLLRGPTTSQHGVGSERVDGHVHACCCSRGTASSGGQGSDR